MSLARFFKEVRYRIFYALFQTRRFGLLALGNDNIGCQWKIHPDVLNAQSVVYSGGVGNDISFEHELVRRFGCSVTLFDPSPTGLATMAKPENDLPQFRFHPVALAGHCGTLDLEAPLDAAEGSYFAGRAGAATVQVPCTDLASFMRQNGHARIDLLKLDIEGAELEVLAEIVRERLAVRQICVEFHHGLLPGFRRSQTVRAILRLRAAGYRLLDQTGNNHTFLAAKWK